MKCVDQDDPNKFVLIRDGEIVFYENINGVPTPVTPHDAGRAIRCDCG